MKIEAILHSIWDFVLLHILIRMAIILFLLGTHGASCSICPAVPVVHEML